MWDYMPRTFFGSGEFFIRSDTVIMKFCQFLQMCLDLVLIRYHPATSINPLPLIPGTAR